MVIHVNIKKTVVTARTLEELKNKLPYGLCFGSDGNYLTNWVDGYSSNREFAYVYNIRKENKKSKQTKYLSGKKKGRTKGSEVIRRKQWIANVYKFDINLLRASGLMVIQDKHNFKIVKRK